MSKLNLILALIALLALTACGTGSGTIGGFGGGGTSGSFTNANLKGHYAYQIVGTDLTTGTIEPFRESGVFVADGNGNVTAGEDDLADLVDGDIPLSSTLVPSTTGTAYSVSSDGTALLTLNFSNGGAVQLALSVVSSPSVYVVVNALQTPVGGLRSVNGTGVMVPQTAAGFAVPSGPFVFRMQNVNGVTGTATASVGAITVTGGNVAGNEDQNSAASASQLTLTGAFNAPDPLGRGTGTFTDSNNVTLPFFITWSIVATCIFSPTPPSEIWELAGRLLRRAPRFPAATSSEVTITMSLAGSTGSGNSPPPTAVSAGERSTPWWVARRPWAVRSGPRPTPQAPQVAGSW